MFPTGWARKQSCVPPRNASDSGKSHKHTPYNKRNPDATSRSGKLSLLLVCY